MKMLSVEEAKDQLAALVEAAKRGEEIVLTSHGAVVRLVPEVCPVVSKPDPEVVKAFLADLEQGMHIGERNWTRDDIYEERLQRFR